jgi:hypothetical protein
VLINGTVDGRAEKNDEVKMSELGNQTEKKY